MLKHLEPKNIPFPLIKFEERREEYVSIPKELVESDIKAMQYAEAMFYAGVLIREEKSNEPLGIIPKR